MLLVDGCRTGWVGGVGGGGGVGSGGGDCCRDQELAKAEFRLRKDGCVKVVVVKAVQISQKSDLHFHHAVVCECHQPGEARLDGPIQDLGFCRFLWRHS